MVDPARSAKNLRRLAAEGLFGEYGFFEAVDYTDRAGGRISSNGTPVTAFFAHHAGMSLVALANAINDDVMVRRFHSDPRVQATELLLQERVPRQRPVTEPRPEDTMFVSPQSIAVPLRRYQHAAHDHAAHAVPLERQVCGGGHQRRRRRQLLRITWR